MSRTYKDAPDRVRIQNARKGKDHKTAVRLKTKHQHHLAGERVYKRYTGYQAAYDHTHLTIEDLFDAQARYLACAPHDGDARRMHFGSKYVVEYADGTITQVEGVIKDWNDFGPQLIHGKEVAQYYLLYEVFYLSYLHSDLPYVRCYVNDRTISCNSDTVIPEQLSTCYTWIQERHPWYYEEFHRNRARSIRKDQLRKITKAANGDEDHMESLIGELEKHPIAYI